VPREEPVRLVLRWPARYPDRDERARSGRVKLTSWWPADRRRLRRSWRRRLYPVEVEERESVSTVLCCPRAAEAARAFAVAVADVGGGL